MDCAHSMAERFTEWLDDNSCPRSQNHIIETIKVNSIAATKFIGSLVASGPLKRTKRGLAFAAPWYRYPASSRYGVFASLLRGSDLGF